MEMVDPDVLLEFQDDFAIRVGGGDLAFNFAAVKLPFVFQAVARLGSAFRVDNVDFHTFVEEHTPFIRTSDFTVTAS